MREFSEMMGRLAELERRVSLMMRGGTVAEVDPAKGLVRLKIGTGANGDLLSPWIGYGQMGGALKVHSSPSVGQQMAMFAPSGALDQAIALPMGFSDANPSPSGAGDQSVLTFGSATITLAGGGLTIAVGGVSMVISGGGVEITGGAVTHNGVNIGATHKHGGVSTGGAQTAQPT